MAAPPAGRSEQAERHEQEHYFVEQLIGLEHEEHEDKANENGDYRWEIVPLHFAQGLNDMVEVHTYSSRF